MALADRSPVDFVDKTVVPGNLTNPEGTPANYASIGAMRTRLIAINNSYYNTQAGNNKATRLDSMTKNDMVYALRLNDDNHF